MLTYWPIWSAGLTPGRTVGAPSMPREYITKAAFKDYCLKMHYMRFHRMVRTWKMKNYLFFKHRLINNFIIPVIVETIASTILGVAVDTSFRVVHFQHSRQFQIAAGIPGGHTFSHQQTWRATSTRKNIAQLMLSIVKCAWFLPSTPP